MKKIFLFSVLLAINTGCNQFSQMGSESEFAPMGKPENLPQTITDTFIQGGSSRDLDIIWVIDNSGSMEDDQARLGDSFNLFIQDFVSNKNDFQMAITTTDTSSSNKRGRMVMDSDLKLTSLEATRDPAQFMTDFKNLIKVGTGGSGTERGLEAVKGFLEKHGNSFVRPDAILAVVIVSDEKDHSEESVAHYVDLLKKSKDNPGLVRINAIVNFEEKARYEEAAQMTSGSVADITKDFAGTLKALGTSLYQLTNGFPLSKWPSPETMKVYVNGVPQENFNWDSKTNSVLFPKGSLPVEGSEIKLVYNMDK